MENIRRSIKLFFVTYGELLFTIIGIIALVLFVIRGADHLYVQNKEKEMIQNELLQEEAKEDQESINKEKEDIFFISQFLDYCNEKNIEKAYSILSEKCKKDNYQTIEKFENEYINKIFTYEKEYEIEKENDLYKITILEGVLELGSLENRKSRTCYYKIEKSILEKKIYIER